MDDESAAAAADPFSHALRDYETQEEQEALATVHQLLEVYGKSELFRQMEHVMGRVTTRQEEAGYYDDVEGLVELFHEKTSAFHDTPLAKALREKVDTADVREELAVARKDFVVSALYEAINGHPHTQEQTGDKGGDNDTDDEGDLTVEHITSLYTVLESTVGCSQDALQSGLVVGALALVEKQKAEAEKAAHDAAVSTARAQEKHRNQTTGPSSSLASVEVRKSAMKVSPEEMFRMAQLVRSGLADESELLAIRAEGGDGEGGAEVQVELNEEKPQFLSHLGLPSFRKRINYRSLLPSQQLREARTFQQQQAILDRVQRRQEGDPKTLSSMEQSAAAQLKINHDRRLLAMREKRQREEEEQKEESEAAMREQAEAEATEAASAVLNKRSLLHSELDEKVEEGGFSAKELPSRLPPWMRHSCGTSKPRFGLPDSHQSIQEQRRSLPIFQKRKELLAHIDTHPVTILVGETGSGKTTQIPQYLAEHGYANAGVICCTQPRRVAAETLAERVAEEYGCRLGEEVGYTVRFRDVTSSITKIKYMTDGILLREALLDDSFQRYSVIILDEAHERSINTDLLFAIVRNALRKHATLKVLVTSATLETTKFCEYFGADAPFRIEGRTFPVATYYLQDPTTDYVRTALETVMKIHMEEPPGDVLVFFTGQEEIELGGEQLYRWIEQLRQKVNFPLPDMLIFPLTATMPQDVQSKVFEPTPPGTRKIVLATNVAETSITIDNLYYVIDSGFCKQSIFDPKKGMEQLKIVPISQAQAQQRAGRAGRIGPGKCYRIYTEEQFSADLPRETVPDIMRANLFHVTLQLKAMGVDLLQVELMDSPPMETIVAALEKLRYLEALDDDGLLTSLGGRMAQLSIDPSQSKALLTAVDFGCSEPVLTIVSMLAVQRRGVFYRPRDKQEQADAARRQFYQPEGDQIALMAVYDAWIENGESQEWCQRNFLKYRMLVEARDTREQLKDMLVRRQPNISHENDHNLTEVRRALTAGYFFNVAKRVDSHARAYVTLADRKEVFIHPSSVLIEDPPKFVLYDDLRLTKREYMSELLVIEPQWLVELAPAFYAKPKNGRNLTREQEAERWMPILKSWETGSSWRVSKQRRGQQ